MNSLDIGCGKNKQGSIGIDLSRNTQADIIASAQALPFKTETFDACQINMCLEHVDNPYMALLEVQRVLKHKGSFCAEVPCDSKLTFYQLKQILMLRWNHAYQVYQSIKSGDHKWQYSHKGTSMLLQKLGYRTFTIKKEASFPYLDGDLVFTATKE